MTVGRGAEATVTVVDVADEPLELVQVIPYVYVVVDTPVRHEVVVVAKSLPFQILEPPVAVQVVALVGTQVRVEEPLYGMEAGLAVRVTVGRGIEVVALTVMGMVVVAVVPPNPVHDMAKLYVFTVFKTPVETLVLVVACVPDQSPPAEQNVAYVEDHVSRVELPAEMDEDAAEKERVGAGLAQAPEATADTAVLSVDVE